MYKIKNDYFDNVPIKKIINTNTEEFVSIIPDFGVNVLELSLHKQNNIYSILEGFHSYDHLVSHNGFFNSKLFPFAGRIMEGKYLYESKELRFPLNIADCNCALHGFLYNTKMKMIDSICTQNYGKLVFQVILDGTNQGYPFILDINITFTLSEKGLTIRNQIVNCDNKMVPFSDGWHPYFKFNKKVDDLLIKIPSTKQTELSSSLIPTGRVMDNHEYSELTKIDKTEFDNGYQLDNKEGIVTTKLFNPKEDVTINLWQETGENKYNFIQIYTHPNRNCIAIEPLTSNINCLNSGDGLIKLNSGELFCADYGVYLS